METVSCSPADILEDLRHRHKDSAEFAADLKYLLRPHSDPKSDDWETYCSGLVGPDVTELIELLDQVESFSRSVVYAIANGASRLGLRAA
jgi:hypothetical protein